MPTEKRQRQDEGRLNRRLQETAAARRSQRTRNARRLGIAVAVVLAGLYAYSVVASDDDEPVDTTATTTVPDGSTSSTASDGTTIEVAYPGPGASITGDTPCPAADGSSERTTSFEKAPPVCIDAAKDYRATMETSEGTIVIDLDDEAAPIAVNNFVVLSRYRYYEGVPFHRIVPGFVDQAGTPVSESDPAIEATPGYTIPDELPDTSGLASPADAYPDGTLATANRGPDTASSQFFIVVKGGGQQFAANPNYSVFGRVVEGLDVAEAINTHGDGPSNGKPTKQVTITKVTITER